MTEGVIPVLALTFEAAGETGPTGPILNFLREAGVRVTIFMDGRWAEANPALVRQMVQDGHELGNHGYDHPDWTTLNDAEIRSDLKATEDLVRVLTGRELIPWARPPFGALDSRVLETLRALGYQVVYRDAVDGGHWPGETTSDSIVDRSIQSAVDGGVIVYHTNRWETVGALPRVVDLLGQEGFQLKRLSELPAAPPARLERHPDFADLEIRPGYIRPQAAGHWQSMSVLELGALARRQTNHLDQIAQVGECDLSLITGDPSEPGGWEAATQDCFVFVAAGELRCSFRDRENKDAGHLLARAGDLFRCPKDFEYRLGPTQYWGKRWIAMILRPG